MSRPVINIDLDNCVSDFSEEIHAAGEAALHRNLPSHGEWDIAKMWGVSKGAYKRIFRQAVSTGRIWRYTIPHEGALEALWELSDAEYYIRILTHRLNHGFDFRKAVESTVAWLDENHIPYRSIAVIGDEPKSNYKAEVLVDDAPHNIDDWCWNVEDGLAIVMDRPWNNRGQIRADEILYERAMDWPEAVQLIRKRVGQ